MRQSGMKPNDETFSAVLSACTCIGAIKEGFRHFDAMKNDYGIEPKLQHYEGALMFYVDRGISQKLWSTWNFAREFTEIWENAEELMVALDTSNSYPKKIPTPPPKRQPATNMLEGKSRLAVPLHRGVS
ncbi:hypothetical protein MLD38_009334 [Melastoma candidum]|uniref:Uncharacterized protein n=1 Tax=Melastoma candidum TaxID=119954 RepID=A0ACB9RWW3_9MYRT|nr:hypothetical protein MLD38_009334 [Melastoma candidum]